MPVDLAQALASVNTTGTGLLTPQRRPAEAGINLINRGHQIPSGLDTVLNAVGKHKKVSPLAIRNRVLKPIAYHETGGTMDSNTRQQTANDAKGEFTGAGRGLYQFEGTKGSGQGFTTALKRAESWYNQNKIPIPTWLSDVKENDDARDLTADQQSILAVTDFERKKGAKLEKVIKGEQSILDFWTESHWAGSAQSSAEVIKDRRESFKGHYNELLASQLPSVSQQ